jgi:multidrug efflux pump subunit AcrA (membrane-fusion protein)
MSVPSFHSFPSSSTDTPADAERLRKLAEVRARTAVQKAVLQARIAARRAATRAAAAAEVAAAEDARARAAVVLQSPPPPSPVWVTQTAQHIDPVLKKMVDYYWNF